MYHLNQKDDRGKQHIYLNIWTQQADIPSFLCFGIFAKRKQETELFLDTLSLEPISCPLLSPWSSVGQVLRSR